MNYKRYFLALLLGFTTFAQVAKSTPTPKEPAQQEAPAAAQKDEDDERAMEDEIDLLYDDVDTPSGDDIVSTALRYLGCHYRSGGTSPAGFDCSGFTSFIYRLNDMKLTHSSSAQIGEGTRVGRFDLQPGDLVFFAGRGGRGNIGHVGIVVEAYDDGSFSFIHASNGKGVTIDRSTMAYYSSRYRGACRVVD